MSVLDTEASSDLNHKTILVHIRMEKLEGQEQARVASQSWNQFFMLADRNGKKYRCHRFLPTDYYYQNYANMGGRGADDSFSTVPTQWIAHFDVPLDAEGFTLLINNMTFHAGFQPAIIAVRLDR